MDQSIMDRMKESKVAGGSDQDTSEEKLMEMWDMLDETQKQDILGQMEKMCNYSEDNEGGEPTDGKNVPHDTKGGVAIVIQAKK